MSTIFSDYNIRPGDELVHLYPVRVRAEDASGKTLATASSSIMLKNQYRELKLYGHRVQLVAICNPPVGIADGKGHRSVEVTLLNIDSEETVTLDKLEYVVIDCNGKGSASATHQPQEVFAAVLVAPRQRLSGRLSWPDDENGPCRIKVTAHGTTTPGNLEAQAYFDMEMGRPYADSKTADPELVRRINSLLGNPPTFSQVDVERLEREGTLEPGTWERLQKPSGPPHH